MANQQLGVGVCDRSQQCKAAPENCAQHDDELAGIAVGKRPHKGRGHHVEAQKRAGEIADLGLGHMKLILHQRLNREQHVAIHVVEQVQRGQHDQRGARMKFGGGHGSSEYNMARGAAL